MMWLSRQILIAIFIGTCSATKNWMQMMFCEQSDGFWLNSHTEGVTGYAFGGVPLNSRYNCFKGNMFTEIVDQEFKVAFNGSAPPPSKKEQENGRRASLMFPTMTFPTMKPIDFNKENCVDPMIRAGVANAINKAVDQSCQTIVNTILFSLVLPQWAVTCVSFNGQRSSDVISDYNFCQYQTVIGDNIYVIRMAKIDMS